jgi:hypothetical protein
MRRYGGGLGRVLAVRGMRVEMAEEECRGAEVLS